MSLDWQVFTPWTALASGLVIGLATALFVLLNGRRQAPARAGSQA